jgi:hypothetical protein
MSQGFCLCGLCKQSGDGPCCPLGHCRRRLRTCTHWFEEESSCQGRRKEQNGKDGGELNGAAHTRAMPGAAHPSPCPCNGTGMCVCQGRCACVRSLKQAHPPAQLPPSFAPPLEAGFGARRRGWWRCPRILASIGPYQLRMDAPGQAEHAGGGGGAPAVALATVNRVLAKPTLSGARAAPRTSAVTRRRRARGRWARRARATLTLARVAHHPSCPCPTFCVAPWLYAPSMFHLTRWAPPWKDLAMRGEAAHVAPSRGMQMPGAFAPGTPRYDRRLMCGLRHDQHKVRTFDRDGW